MTDRGIGAPHLCFTSCVKSNDLPFDFKRAREDVMDIELLLVRLLLAGVFLVAAAAKLADRGGFGKAVTDFGLPVSFAGPLGILLPLVELAIGILLVAASTAWWGGLGALVLLLTFTGGIGVNLARGRKPECHCFGQLHSRPVGWRTLVRNVLFAACAGFIVWRGRGNPGPGVLEVVGNWTGGHPVTLIFAIVVLVALAAGGWLIFHLLRQHGRLLLRIDNLEFRLNASGIAIDPTPTQVAAGLPVGSPAPSFELPLLSGERLTLDALRKGGKPVLLIFSDPNCTPCDALLPEVAFWERKYASDLTLALVSRGTVEANRAKASARGLKNVLIQQDREVAEKYRAEATPSAVLIHPDGSIGTHLAIGPQVITELVSQITGSRAPVKMPLLAGNGHHKNTHAVPQPHSGLKIGASAPSFSLLDLSGRPVQLNDFKGRDTLVLFWNPNCGFCNRMLPDLKAWESNRHRESPELLVISTGAEGANRAMGLRSTVVLDQGFSVGRAFGVGGTPSAVLVDAEGMIASAVAVGAPAVFELAATEPERVKST